MTDPNQHPDYAILLDPAETERVGTALAEQLREHTPDSVVLLDEYSDDVVLGHVVARTLQIDLSRVLEASGVLEIEGASVEGRRAAVVASGIDQEGTLRSVTTLLEQRNSTVAVVGVLRRTEVTSAAGAPVVVGDGSAGEGGAQGV